MRTSGLHEAGQGCNAAVDDELGAGAVGRVIASEERDDVGNLLGLTHALETGHPLAAVLLAVLVHDRARHRGVDAARVHGVDADAVLAVLEGGNLGDPALSELARRVGRTVWS